MSLTSAIRGLLRGTTHSTRSAFKFRTDFGCKTCAIQSMLKLIFLAASNLAQLMQRPSPRGGAVERTGPPHFSHLAGTIMGTSFMIISNPANYKEDDK